MNEVRSAWQAMLAELGPAVEDIGAVGLGSGTTEAEARTGWSLLSAMAQYVVNFRNQSPDQPQFTPLLNDVLNSNPNPDYTYRIARVSGDRRYVISGTRGTTRFVEFQQMAGLDGTVSGASRLLARFNLDDYPIAEDGSFTLELGPAGTGTGKAEWIDLDRDVTTLFVRECASDWIREIDARLGISCLDAAVPTQQITAASTARALAELPAWARSRVAQWTAHVRRQQEARPMGELQAHAFVGGMMSQIYYEGYYELSPDHALVLETDLPDTCLYWGILLTNDRYVTVDWLRHHSSLNDTQAAPDPDGRLRAVIALEDPGYANWIDPGGNRAGLIQLRWNGASSNPQPRLAAVPLAELEGRMHPEARRVGPAERAQTLRQRRIGAQLRRRW